MTKKKTTEEAEETERPVESYAVLDEHGREVRRLTAEELGEAEEETEE